jgi:Co/Zn/Cd efflux system component
VIARWSWGLMRDAGGVLLDYLPDDEELPAEIREAIEIGGDQITDLHVWQLGPGHHGAIVSIISPAPEQVSVYRTRLTHLSELSHVTIEIQKMAA